MRRWGSWALDAALLFGLTAFIIWPWLRMDYLESWGSIESTFISDARYLRENLPHPGWQPNWYCGTRWDYIYPPALRYATALVSLWGGVSTARAYHLYTGVMYALGIAGVYLLVRAGSGSRWWAWVAAGLAGLASPTFLFIGEIRADNVPVRFWPMRLGVLVRYGEGPHMSAFAALGWALAATWTGLRRGRTGWLIAASVGAAAVVSNNFYGATALALWFPLMVWAVWLAERDHGVWLRAAGISALAYGLTASWLTPSYLTVTMRNMRLVSQPGHAWSAALWAAVMLGFALASWKWGKGRPGRAWGIWVAGVFLTMALFVLGNHYVDFRVLGEPQRLIPEFDLAFILAGCAIAAVLWRRHWAGKLVVLAVLAWVAVVEKGWVRRAWEYQPAAPGYEHRMEYQVTRWIHENLPGRRVFATGSLRFWYNAWFDLPQLGGGSEQGTLNINSSVAYYQTTYPTPVEWVKLWMQAMGVDVIAVAEATSQDEYKDFGEPERFRGKLELIRDDGAGNLLYRVPRRWPGLARVVESARMAEPLGPAEKWDETKLARYVDAVENGPAREAQWKRDGNRRMRVEVELKPGEKLLVQESYDPAWRARAAGRELRVGADPIGFLLVDAGAGRHHIELEFETPLENRIGQVVSGLSLAVIAGLGWASRRNRRHG